MREVAKELINMNFHKADTLDDCLDAFYDIMRKHGIKQGTPSKNEEGEVVGRTVSTPEWVACKTLFINSMNNFFVFADLLGEVPEDIR